MDDFYSYHDDFCLIHGYDYMVKSSIFDPIPYCSKCEEENHENATSQAEDKEKPLDTSEQRL